MRKYAPGVFVYAESLEKLYQFMHEDDFLNSNFKPLINMNDGGDIQSKQEHFRVTLRNVLKKHVEDITSNLNAS